MACHRHNCYLDQPRGQLPTRKLSGYLSSLFLVSKIPSVTEVSVKMVTRSRILHWPCRHSVPQHALTNQRKEAHPCCSLPLDGHPGAHRLVQGAFSSGWLVPEGLLVLHGTSPLYPMQISWLSETQHQSYNRSYSSHGASKQGNLNGL